MLKKDVNILMLNENYQVYQNLIKLDEWKIVYQNDKSSVFIPTSKNKAHWIVPDDKFRIDYNERKNRILN